MSLDLLRCGDRLLVDLEDDVAGLELLLGRRAVGCHFGDDDDPVHLVGQAEPSRAAGRSPSMQG
jgi:hypothetical protein